MVTHPFILVFRALKQRLINSDISSLNHRRRRSLWNGKRYKFVPDRDAAETQKIFFANPTFAN
jgi:hypothetical protein